VSEAIHREILSLPIGPHTTEDQCRAVSAKLRDLCSQDGGTYV
ncbi:MAG: hypothetical protein N3B12_07590, partial [Armatimonadetes bacterium]|nr:hypothetical protein [Armatimonadota bacterium]